MATKNQTRPSYARVSVEVEEVDLLGEFPKNISVGMKRKDGEMVEKWTKINYDYVPKYCKTCMIQGHNEEQCHVEHPELYPKDAKKKASKSMDIGKKATDKNKEKVQMKIEEEQD